MKVHFKYAPPGRADHLKVTERGAVVSIVTNGHKLIVRAEDAAGHRVHVEVTVDRLAAVLAAGLAGEPEAGT